MNILWMKQAETDVLAGGQHRALQHSLEQAGYSVRVQQTQSRMSWRGSTIFDWIIWSFVPTPIDVWRAKLYAKRQMGLVHEIADKGRTLPSLDHWCVASESLRTTILDQGVACERVSVWQGYVNGTDQMLNCGSAGASPSHHGPSAKSGTVIHAAGAHEASTGSLLAVWALRMVQYLHPQVSMVLHGDGPMAERVRNFATSTCEAGTVSFVKYASVNELVSRADVVWIPRMQDGVPDALYCALSHGKPIVAADQPSLREWLRHEENAILLPTDQAPLWAGAMNRLLMEKGLAESLGNTAKRTVIPELQLELPACLEDRHSKKRLAKAA